MSESPSKEEDFIIVFDEPDDLSKPAPADPGETGGHEAASSSKELLDRIISLEESLQKERKAKRNRDLQIALLKRSIGELKESRSELRAECEKLKAGLQEKKGISWLGWLSGKKAGK
ncbi:MAG: hypothetical protein RDV48_01905 [Candidatus Eremiobacteraeota bacterium]|nr:hypothetical protein [Candidatus Eremiobacteraeota bacterium]